MGTHEKMDSPKVIPSPENTQVTQPTLLQVQEHLEEQRSKPEPQEAKPADGTRWYKTWWGVLLIVCALVGSFLAAIWIVRSGWNPVPDLRPISGGTSRPGPGRIRTGDCNDSFRKESATHQRTKRAVTISW